MIKASKNTLLLFVLLLSAVFTSTFAIGAPETIRPLKIIVIDPGHGGEDWGAKGPGGLKEKDLTLNIAKKVKGILSRTTKAKIYLTRSTDKFIPLEDRTKIANDLKADLFVSIHANASKRRAANGIETYFLSPEASDDEAQKTAEMENSSGGGSGNTKGSDNEDISAILFDLNQSEAHRRSQDAAEIINSAIVKATNGEDRGVKQAPFIVLDGATMPAVLIEIGFISNPKEENELSKSIIQQTIAYAIAKGVRKLDATLRGLPGYARMENTEIKDKK